MLFFTSDTHFYHELAIQHNNRPFASVEEMNEALIENWNYRVRPGDIIYFLGDFYLGKGNQDTQVKQILGVLSRLNGQIVFIKGNHDHSKIWKKVLPQAKKIIKFDKMMDLKIKDPDCVESGGNQFLVLCHNALLTWNRAHYGAWDLYGHSHGNLKGTRGKQLDVGVDCHDYYPISYEEVKHFMSNKDFEVVDHHKEEF